jgi:SsrA-binding protein
MCHWRAASANSIHKQERLINVKSVSTNRKAGFEYFLFERFEAGLALKGSEIKSILAGQISLAEAYVRVDDTRSAFLMEAHIAPYEQANRFNHDPKRARRLLLKGQECLSHIYGSPQKSTVASALSLI